LKIVWRNLVLYDGECGLCDRLVQFLLRHDKRGVLSYAPLQGETARPFVGDQPALDTMMFVERADDGSTRVFVRSRGAFRILGKLGWFWRILSWARILPVFLTDLGYRFIAKNRIRWFGRVDACRIPDASLKPRFLA
jgi:predicted DCC family thiol-disulfide oxidoreductase YuxK